ncbi:LacI family DNA-binding transcriptional regulator [Sphingomonas sp. ASY06-1R]|uniref:LacI family DNA-binding transcriptional regulator n=1 Tax=Sphingomonas sp. ASY06-1R TaxID=3445771 RepID=UPI003FA2CA18
MNDMSPHRPPATISDVALAAGVSIKTVSRVFNAEPNVRAETRRHVLQIGAALDYHPNMAARSLAGGRSQLIGLLHDNPCGHYILGLEAGTLDRLRGDRWRLLVMPCEDSARMAMQTVALVRSTGIAGVMLSSPICDNKDIVNGLIAARIPLVRIGPTPDPAIDAVAPSVGVDDRSAAADMARHLLALGHRRVAVLRGDPVHPSSKARWEGFTQAMRDAGAAIEPDLIGCGMYAFEGGLSAARSLLDRADRPTAIFAENDDMATGAIIAAGERGIAVPTALSVVGFDDSQIARTVWPRVTTIRQPLEEMAQAAADALIALLEGSRRTIAHRLLPYELVIRESSGPAAGSGLAQ